MRLCATLGSSAISASRRQHPTAEILPAQATLRNVTTGNLPLYGTGTEVSKWQGSGSIIHVPSGVYLNGAIVNQEYRQGPGTVDLVFGGQRPDTRLYYVQGGIAKNWTGAGNTVLYGEWARVNDGASGLITADGDSLFNTSVDMWGLGVVQHIDAAAMEVYLAYRQFEASADSLAGGPWGVGGDLDTLRVLTGGARVRF